MRLKVSGQKAARGLVGKTDGRRLVLYGRVSGQGQKADLETQLARLSLWAEKERAGRATLVLSDIGSGLSAARRQLQRLLRLVREDQVAEIVVTCRTEIVHPKNSGSGKRRGLLFGSSQKRIGTHWHC